MDGSSVSAIENAADTAKKHWFGGTSFSRPWFVRVRGTDTDSDPSFGVLLTSDENPAPPFVESSMPTFGAIDPPPTFQVTVDEPPHSRELPVVGAVKPKGSPSTVTTIAS